jgi:glycosyltransferase involved in cell wall biosynthesis
MGGEAMLPLQYFRLLRQRGIDAHLICHDRTRDELAELFPGDLDRIHFVADKPFHRLLNRVAAKMPNRVCSAVRAVISLDTQRSARNLVRELAKNHTVQLVHQPAPVSPRQPSWMHRAGVPVMIGPMNGGMTEPPQLRVPITRAERVVSWFTTVGSGAMNRLIPGKRSAARLIVANPRTAAALPVRRSIVEIPENGVDLSRFPPVDRSSRGSNPSHRVKFLFLSRLEAFKGTDLLLDAFAQLTDLPVDLDLVGDGPMRQSLLDQWTRQGQDPRVRFVGAVDHARVAETFADADVFVLPSWNDCGGAVILEAMASGLPSIALRWGGPADYLTESTGILIDPRTREQIVTDLAAAMRQLATHPALRESMGRAARERVEQHFDWNRKIDQMLALYQQTLASPR